MTKILSLLSSGDTLKSAAILTLIFGGFITLCYGLLLLQNGYLIGLPWMFNIEVAKNIGPFLSGVGAFFTLGSALLVLANLRETQNKNALDGMNNQKAQFEKVFFDLLAMHDRSVRAIDAEVSRLHNDKISGDGRLVTASTRSVIRPRRRVTKKVMEAGQEVKVIEDVEEETIEEVPAEQDKVKTEKGKNFIQWLAVSIAHEYVYRPDKGKAVLLEIYERYFQVYNTDLGQYFRSLYYIVTYLHGSTYLKSISGNPIYPQMTFYFGLLRAQLSNAELALIALNGMTEIGKDFGEFCREYELLKNLNFELSMPFEYEQSIGDPRALVEAYPYLAPIYAGQKQRANVILQPPGNTLPWPWEANSELSCTLFEVDKGSSRSITIKGAIEADNQRWYKIKYTQAPGDDREYWAAPELIGSEWRV